ncbi:MAG: hypothetical protein FD147_721 [Chloroflexi bacterium]|nr:MAG: hypothetical protein FD147_721 [Chloroflexota bacterium]
MKKRINLLQILIHLGGGAPSVVLLYRYLTNNLTANPIQALEQQTGLTALIFLMLSLACSPLGAIFDWKNLSKQKKALGVYGFIYAAIHLLLFIGLDYGFNFIRILRDVSNKIYVLFGLTAFLLLLPLAVTSFRYFKKLLGKNWKRLHRLVYIISPIVIVHFFLVFKGNLARLQGNIIKPSIYGALVLLLLILRIPVVKRALILFRIRIQERLRKTYPL